MNLEEAFRKAKSVLERNDSPTEGLMAAMNLSGYLQLGGDPALWETFEPLTEDGDVRLVRGSE